MPEPFPHWPAWEQPHSPLLHAFRPCAVQSLPQPPQFSASEAVLVSQPSSLPVEGVVQFAEPTAQLETQRPSLHSTEATPVVAQARSQAPQ